VVETRPGQESPQVGYTISPECSLHEKVQSNCPSVGIPLWDATFAIANVPSCTGKESDIFSPKISMEMCWVTIQNLHYTVNVTCSWHFLKHQEFHVPWTFPLPNNWHVVRFTYYNIQKFTNEHLHISVICLKCTAQTIPRIRFRFKERECFTVYKFSAQQLLYTL